MMNRELYMKSITEKLTLYKLETSELDKINLYDINITSENFYAGLLNLIMGWNLRNVNFSEKNTPGIDLVDDDNKITVQVTSNNTSDKIKHTIDEFIKKKSYEKYSRLIVLISTEKKNYTAIFDTQQTFEFDKENDIWDVSDLIQKINALSTDQQKKIYEYLQVEMGENVLTRSEAMEVETIMDLIEFITSNRLTKYKRIKTVVDPEYKIYNRFKKFANRLTGQYLELLGIYGSALVQIESIRGIDEGEEIIIRMYLQDLSIKYLEEAQDDPMEALNKLVNFFEIKLGKNGKKYDKAAIKFYLINELIKCNVFPNERSEYDGSEF